MTTDKKDKIIDWFKTMTFPDVLKIGAIFWAVFQFGAYSKGWVDGYKKEQFQVNEIYDDVKIIKADKAILNSNIILLNDSMKRYEERRETFYASNKLKHVH